MVGPEQSESSSSSIRAAPFRVSVNVRLCGSIPRKDLLTAASAMAASSSTSSSRMGGAPCLLAACLTSRGVFASANGSTDDPPTLAHLSKTAPNLLLPPTTTNSRCADVPTQYDHNANNSSVMGGGSEVLLHQHSQQPLPHTVSHEPQQPLGLVLEPPTWAVPARGESRLEVCESSQPALLSNVVLLTAAHLEFFFSVFLQPVCDALDRQSAVDLTARACFRVGRSPNMDVQLLHATSSRRHALLFHHSNGSCYVVDCGSAHGTFVNGIRIASPSSGGVVVPHKVKRGALVRFGGPGAPCFLLKSFSFQLTELDESVVKMAPPDAGELVRRNTRLNALGRTAGERLRDSVFRTIDSALAVPTTRKRSFDCLDSTRIELNQPSCAGKRLRYCASPPPSPEEPPLRLVSPDLPPAMIAKRVTFSSEPPRLFYPALVTPEELSSGEEDNAE